MSRRIFWASSTTNPVWKPAGKVAEAVPDGRFVRLEGGFHEVPPAVLVPALAEFYQGGE